MYEALTQSLAALARFFSCYALDTKNKKVIVGKMNLSDLTIQCETKSFIFSRTTGLYTKTLAKIIQEDLTRFIAVFIVIFLPFGFSLSLSLCQGSYNHHEFR